MSAKECNGELNGGGQAMLNSSSVQTEYHFGPHAALWLADAFFTFTLMLTFSALFHIQGTLHNPFGPRRIDVAHEVIAGGIRRLAESLMSGSRLPPSLLTAGEHHKHHGKARNESVSLGPHTLPNLGA